MNNTDWFIDAIRDDISLDNCLEIVEKQLIYKTQFINSLRNSLYSKNNNSIYDLKKKLNSLEDLISNSIGNLQAEREAAWFRVPTCVNLGPFGSKTKLKPVFNKYETKEYNTIANKLKKNWTNGTKAHIFSDDSECLWLDLLSLNSTWYSINNLKVGDKMLYLTNFKKSSLNELYSESLCAFITNVKRDMTKVKTKLDSNFDTLWNVSMRLWNFQANYIKQGANSAKKTRQQFKQTRNAAINYKIKSHLETLGFSAMPNKQQLKQRYLALAKQLHPDKNQGNEEEFITLNKAFKEVAKL